MTMTAPVVDDMVITVLDEELSRPCEHGNHDTDKYHHSKGDAEFDVMYPCGFTHAVCEGWVDWLLGGGLVDCSRRKKEQHDVTSIIITRLPA